MQNERCNHVPYELTGYCVKCGSECSINNDPTARYEVPDTIRLSDAMYDEFHRKIGFRMVCINNKARRNEDLTLTFDPSSVSPDTLATLPRFNKGV